MNMRRVCKLNHIELGVTLAGTPSGFTYVPAQCSFTNVGLAQGPSVIICSNFVASWSDL